MTPVEFLARLASLILPPRIPLVRYFGVLAPNSPYRERVVPKTQPHDEPELVDKILANVGLPAEPDLLADGFTPASTGRTWAVAQLCSSTSWTPASTLACVHFGSMSRANPSQVGLWQRIPRCVRRDGLVLRA